MLDDMPQSLLQVMPKVVLEAMLKVMREPGPSPTGPPCRTVTRGLTRRYGA